MAGGSLFDLLHPKNQAPGATALVRLPLSRVLRFCTGIASGMAYLHAHGVMHRDLKSGNLLLDAAREHMPKEPRIPNREDINEQQKQHASQAAAAAFRRRPLCALQPRRSWRRRCCRCRRRCGPRLALSLRLLAALVSRRATRRPFRHLLRCASYPMTGLHSHWQYQHLQGRGG